jgi:hypothetical protein
MVVITNQTYNWSVCQIECGFKTEYEEGGLAIDDPGKSSFHLGLHANVMRGCLACSDLQLSVYRRIVDSLFIRICILCVYLYIYI